MRSIIKDLYQRNRSLTIMTIAYFILAFFLFIFAIFDNTQILGINRWIKPIKFAISIGVFLWTFIYLLDLLDYTPRRVSIFSNIFIYTMLIEIIAIVGQAARGQQSHFNIQSPLGNIIFSIMGLAIMTAFVVVCIITISYFKQKTAISSSLIWAIRLGLLLFIFANIGGMIMSGMLRHTIGAPDGGDGLILVNWSTIAGDLRVMHFFGMHGIQLFPLVALGMKHIRFIQKEQTQLNIIKVLAIFYSGFVIITFIQALMGISFIH